MCLTMLSLFCALVFTFVAADDNTHTYAADEAVTLWVNTIGPFHNPTEIYAYYGTCVLCVFSSLPLPAL
jgi:transmembrane 9 superfamily member 3